MFFHRSALHHRSGVRIHRQCAAVSSADGDGRGRPRMAQKSHPWAPPSIPFRRRQRVAVSLAAGLVGRPHGWHKKATRGGVRPSPFKGDNVPRCHRPQDTRNARWLGLRQCALPLFWLGHFSWAMLFPPTQPPGNPTRAAWMQRPALSMERLRRTTANAILMHPRPPLFGESGCMHSTRACTFFVRCRPLLGGVRWAARGGVDMCHAVWCVPVRMGIVLARSFSIAHAAPTHQTAMRRTLAQTQGVP